MLTYYQDVWDYLLGTDKWPGLGTRLVLLKNSLLLSYGSRDSTGFTQGSLYRTVAILRNVEGRRRKKVYLSLKILGTPVSFTIITYNYKGHWKRKVPYSPGEFYVVFNDMRRESVTVGWTKSKRIYLFFLSFFLIDKIHYVTV